MPTLVSRASRPTRPWNTTTAGPPLVSICIPTRNHAPMLRDALASACAQDHAHLEIVVCDNASTDETPEVIAARSRLDPRVRGIRQAHDVGMAANFQRCLQESRGEYVKFLCDDDLLEPTCVSRLAAVLSEHPAVALVACARRVVADDLQPLALLRRHRRFRVQRARHAVREALFRGNRIGEPTAVLFRRAAAARGFSTEYTQLLDLEMWLRLLERGDLAYVPETLCSIRQHATQATQANVRAGVVIADKRRLFESRLAKLSPPPRPWERWAWDLRLAVSLARVPIENRQAARIEALQASFSGAKLLDLAERPARRWLAWRRA